MLKAPAKRRRIQNPACRLKAPGWNPRTRLALERLITDGAGRHLPVVFDFDNTIIGGDIGEATLAVLASSGVLTPATAPAAACPTFRGPSGRRIRLESCADITEYYEALLTPTVHGPADTSSLANGYVWAVEVMQNLRLTQVVKAAADAFHWADPSKPGFIEVTPGKTAYPVPFFYPEMVELLAELLRRQYDVWICSASNVWSVRWMVVHALNPLLFGRGLKHGVRPGHVVGVATLLADRKGRLYKDTVLVREDEAYAGVQRAALARFRLTRHLQFPLPTYSGKIAALFDALGRNPYLVAGDSPGDLPMLALSPHRLWIARDHKPVYQQAAAEYIQRTGGTGWMIQSTGATKDKGFYATSPLPSSSSSWS